LSRIQHNDLLQYLGLQYEVNKQRHKVSISDTLCLLLRYSVVI